MNEPDTLYSTIGKEPYEYFARLRAEGDVVWDTAMRAWLVTGYDVAKEMMRDDDKVYHHFHMDSPALLELAGGRHIKFFSGDAHRRVHQWMLRAMSPARVEEWRGPLIRPVIDHIIDRIAPRGRAELYDELAGEVGVRIIATIMGLPAEDDAWVARIRPLLSAISAVFNAHLQLTDDILQRALVASRELDTLVRPLIDARADGKGDDIISALWRDGPGLVEDWGPSDVRANVRALVFAASDTTAHAVANGLYVLMTQPELARQVRAGGETALAAFVEEVLRIYGASHLRTRQVDADVTLGGCPIAKGSTVVMLQGSANRDERHYANPDSVDLARANSRDHLAFNFGPRSCVGAALARADIQETLAAALRRLPNLRLDPEAKPPVFEGLNNRCFKPLHSLFDAGH